MAKLRAPKISVESDNDNKPVLILEKSPDDVSGIDLVASSQGSNSQILNATSDVSVKHLGRDYAVMQIDTLEVPYDVDLDKVNEFNTELNKSRVECQFKPELATPMYIVEPTIENAKSGASRRIIEPLHFVKNSGLKTIGSVLDSSDTIDSAFTQSNIEFTNLGFELDKSRNVYVTDKSKLQWNQFDFKQENFNGFAVDIKTLSQNYPYSIVFSAPYVCGITFTADDELSIVFKDKLGKYKVNHFEKMNRYLVSYDGNLAQLYVNGEKINLMAQEYVNVANKEINVLGLDVKDGNVFENAEIQIDYNVVGESDANIRITDSASLYTKGVSLEQDIDIQFNKFPKIIKSTAQGFIPQGHRDPNGLTADGASVMSYDVKIADVVDTSISIKDFSKTGNNQVTIDVRDSNNDTIESNLNNIAFSNLKFTTTTTAEISTPEVNGVVVPKDIDLPQIPLFNAKDIDLTKVKSSVVYKPSFVGQSSTDVTYGASVKSIYNLVTASQELLPEPQSENIALTSSTRSLSVCAIIENANNRLTAPGAWNAALQPFLIDAQVNYIVDSVANKGYRGTANAKVPYAFKTMTGDKETIEVKEFSNVVTGIEFKFGPTLDVVVQNQNEFKGTLLNNKKYVANIMSFSCFAANRDNTNFYESELIEGAGLKGALIIFQVFDTEADLKDAIKVSLNGSQFNLTQTEGKTLTQDLISSQLGQALLKEATLEHNNLNSNQNSLDMNSFFKSGIFIPVAKLYDIELIGGSSKEASTGYRFVTKFREVYKTSTGASDRILLRFNYDANNPRPAGHQNLSYNESIYAFSADEALKIFNSVRGGQSSDMEIDTFNQRLLDLNKSKQSPYNFYRGLDIVEIIKGFGNDATEVSNKLTELWSSFVKTGSSGVYIKAYNYSIASCFFSNKRLKLTAVANTRAILDPIFYVYPSPSKRQFTINKKAVSKSPIVHSHYTAPIETAMEVGQLIAFAKPLTQEEVKHDLEYGKVWRDYNGLDVLTSRLVPDLTELKSIVDFKDVRLKDSIANKLSSKMPMGSWQSLTLDKSLFDVGSLLVTAITIPEQDEEFNKYCVLYEGINTDFNSPMISFRTKEGVINPADWDKPDFQAPNLTLKVNISLSNGNSTEFIHNFTLTKPVVLGLIWQTYNRDTIVADVGESVFVNSNDGDQSHYIRWMNKTPEELHSLGLLNPQYTYRWSPKALVTPDRFVYKNDDQNVVRVPSLAWAKYSASSIKVKGNVNGVEKDIELPKPFVPNDNHSVTKRDTGSSECREAMWGYYKDYPQVILGSHANYKLPFAHGGIGHSGLICVEFYINPSNTTQSNKTNIIHGLYLTNAGGGYSVMQINVVSIDSGKATIEFALASNVTHIHSTKVPVGQWVKAFIFRDRANVTDLTKASEVKYKCGIQLDANSDVNYSSILTTSEEKVTRGEYGYQVLAVGDVANYAHNSGARIDCQSFDGLVNLSNTFVWNKSKTDITDFDLLLAESVQIAFTQTDETFDNEFESKSYVPSFDMRYPAIFKSEFSKGYDSTFKRPSYLYTATDMWDYTDNDNLVTGNMDDGGGSDYDTRAYHDIMANQASALSVEGYQPAAANAILDTDNNSLSYKWQVGKSKLTQYLENEIGLPTCSQYQRTILFKDLKSLSFTNDGRLDDSEAFKNVYSADSANYKLVVNTGDNTLSTIINDKGKEWNTRRDFNLDAFTFIPRHHTASFDVVVRHTALNRSLRYKLEFMSMGEFVVNPSDIIKSLFSEDQRQGVVIESVSTFSFDASKIHGENVYLGNAIIKSNTEVHSVVPRAFRVWFEGYHNEEDQEIAGFLLSATGLQLKNANTTDGSGSYDTTYCKNWEVKQGVYWYQGYPDVSQALSNKTNRGYLEPFTKADGSVEACVTLGAPSKFNAGRTFFYNYGWREDNRLDWFKSAIDARFNSRSFAMNTTLRYAFLKSNALSVADDSIMRISYMGQHNLLGGNVMWGKAGYNGMNYAPGNDMTGAIARTFERPLIAQGNSGGYPNAVEANVMMNFGASSAEYSVQYTIKSHNLKNFSSRHGFNPRVDYRYFNPTKDNVAISQGYGSLSSMRYAVSKDGNAQVMGRHLAMYKGREWYSSMGGSLVAGEFVVNARGDNHETIDNSAQSWSNGVVHLRYLPYGYNNFKIESGGNYGVKMQILDCAWKLANTAPIVGPSRALYAGTTLPSASCRSDGVCQSRMAVFTMHGCDQGSSGNVDCSRSYDNKRLYFSEPQSNEILASEGGCAVRYPNPYFNSGNCRGLTAWAVGTGYQPQNINHITIPVQKSPHFGDLIIDTALNSDWKEASKTRATELYNIVNKKK